MSTTKKSLAGFALTLMALVQTACFQMHIPGLSGNSSAASTSQAQASFSCNPNVAPMADHVLRLTVLQYQNMVSSVVSRGLTGSDLTGFPGFLITTLSTTSFPAEGAYGKGNSLIYDTEDQSESSTLVQAESDYAFAVASWVASTPSRLSYFVNFYAPGACPATVSNQGVSQACYDAFIKGFGLYALRRPVRTTSNSIDATTVVPAAANDLAYYESVYNDATNGGFDTLITVMLTSPDAAFLSQFSGTVTGASASTSQVTLTSYETASKLAFYYTNFPPDSALYAAAASGFSGGGNTIAAQATRLMASPLAKPRFADFYTQWIRPLAIPGLTPSTNSPMTNNAAATPATLATLRLEAIQELVDLTTYYTFGVNGHASDLVTSPISFAKTADLAALYGVPTWQGPNVDGTYNSSTLVTFPSTAPRAGMFTRAAYAFSGAGTTNPIIRGARLWKDYFCEDLSPPAQTSLSTTVTVVGPPTVRNIVVANTEVPGTACIGCHQSPINPLGFALENYDSYGRYRTVETLFNSAGVMTGTAPINASAQPFTPFNNTTQVNDPVSYSNQIGQLDAFNSCFVRHYFRYSQGRPEVDATDGCQLTQMLGALTNSTNTGSIASMINSVATAPSFQVRNITP